ncbi:LOW QUALITY PROTEIN: alpha-2-macroglobulin-like protein 1 [Erethizon dorsatum]
MSVNVWQHFRPVLSLQVSSSYCEGCGQRKWNMVDVEKVLNGPPSYPTKYFGCELRALAQFDVKNGRYIVHGSHEANKLQEMFDGFIKKCVLCPESSTVNWMEQCAGRDKSEDVSSGPTLASHLSPSQTINHSCTPFQGNYLVTLPAWLNFPSTRKVCLDLRAGSHYVKFTITLETKDKTQKLLELSGLKKAHLPCTSFLLPPSLPCGATEEVALTVIGVGNNFSFGEKKTVLAQRQGSGAFIHTDQGVYLLGQEQQNMMGPILVTTNSNFVPVNDKYSKVELQDPHGNRIAQWLEVAPRQGLDLSFQLAPEVVLGTYTVAVAEDKTFGTFSVEEFVMEEGAGKRAAPRLSQKTERKRAAPGTDLPRGFEIYSQMGGDLAAASVTPLIGGVDSADLATRQVSLPALPCSTLLKLCAQWKRTPAPIEEDRFLDKGVALSATQDVHVSSQVGLVTFEDTNNFYYPNFPFSGKVYMSWGHDDSLLKNHPVFLVTYGGKELISQTPTTDNTSLAFFTLGTVGWNRTGISLEVPHYQNAYLYLEPFYNTTHSFLSIHQLKGLLKCGQPQEAWADYDTDPVDAGPDHLLLWTSTFHRCGAWSAPSQANTGLQPGEPHSAPCSWAGWKGSFSLSLTFTSTLAPDPALVTYAIFPSWGVVANKIWFSAKMCFDNQASLGFSPSQQMPGADTELQLQAAPGSLCTLRGAGQEHLAVLLLRVSPPQLVSRLESSAFHRSLLLASSAGGSAPQGAELSSPSHRPPPLESAPLSASTSAARALGSLSCRSLSLSPTVGLPALQPFFVHLTLPSHVGESFCLAAAIFSYLKTCILAYLLHQKPTLNRRSPHPLGATRHITGISWELPDMKTQYKALDSREPCGGQKGLVPERGWSDALIKPVLVKPEAVLMEKNHSLLCPKGKVASESVSLELPVEVVSDSTKASITALGDLKGTTLQNLDRLVQMLSGYREQNMVIFAPVNRMQPLKWPASLKGLGMFFEVITEISNHICFSGYQKVLTHKHSHGSSSTFGERDGAGNTGFPSGATPQNKPKLHTISWRSPSLTRFPLYPCGLAAFVRKSSGHSWISIFNDDKNIRDAVRWMTGKQLPHDEEAKVHRVCKLPAVWATKAGLRLATMLLCTFQTQGEAGTCRGAVGDEVSLVAYIMAALLDRGKTKEAYRGFSSTQDTFVAVQALAKNATIVYVSSEKVSLDVKSTGNFQHTFNLHPANLVMQQETLANMPGHTLEALGQGCAYAQTMLRYNIFPPKNVETFSLSVEVGKAGCEQPTSPSLTLTIHTSYVGSHSSSNMATAEVRMLPGLSPTEGTKQLLLQQPPGKKVESGTDKLDIDLEVLCKEIQTFTFTTNPSVGHQPASSNHRSLRLITTYQEEDGGLCQGRSTRELLLPSHQPSGTVHSGGAAQSEHLPQSQKSRRAQPAPLFQVPQGQGQGVGSLGLSGAVVASAT